CGSVMMMSQPKHNGGIGLVVVVVLDFDFDAAIARKIGSIETIGREGIFPSVEKPIGMLDNPIGVNAHVVRNHVAGHADAEVRRSPLQVVERLISAKISGNIISLERICGGDGIMMTAQPLNGARCRAALPKSDEP